MRITQPRPGEPIRLVRVHSGVRYKAVVDVAPTGAKRKQVVRTFRTLKQAREFVTTTRAGLSSGTYTPPSGETVAQLCARWLDTKRDVREVTRSGYRGYLVPVIRHLGDRKVQALTIADMDGLVTWLSDEGGHRGGPLSPRSVKASLNALGQALDLAVREGTVTRNVSRLVKRPRVRTVVGDDLQHWRPDQLLRFVAHADTDPLAAAWRLSASGLTRADVMGLRWSDVDMSTGVARVSQGRVQLDRGSAVDDPKSNARRRAVPVEQMWPGTVAALRALRARQAADRLAAGTAYTDTGLVVVDALGQPVSPQWYSDRFTAICRQAGLPVIWLHGLRHSLAFWLHSVGVSPADAAGLLGHTVDVHLSTYLPHSGASGIAAAARALGQAARVAEGSL